MKVLGYVLGKSVLAVLQLACQAVMAAGYLLAVVARPLTEAALRRTRTARSTVQAVGKRSDARPAEPPAEASQAQQVAVPTAATAIAPFEPADRIISIRLQPAVGVIHLRVFQARGVVKRDLIISEPKLRCLMKGRRHTFADAPYQAPQALDAIKDETVALAERLINELGNGAVQAAKAAKATDSTQVRRVDPPTLAPQQAQPAGADAAAPTGAAPALQATPVLADIAVPQRVRRPITYVGRLVNAGSTIVTPDGRPPYEVFEARLALDNGAEMALRGAELERELLACACQLGQRVEITAMGKVPVNFGNGGEGRKNLYRVRPVAALSQE